MIVLKQTSIERSYFSQAEASETHAASPPMVKSNLIWDSP